MEKKRRRDEAGRRADDGGLKGRGEGKFQQKEDLSFSLRVYSATDSGKEKCPDEEGHDLQFHRG